MVDLCFEEWVGLDKQGRSLKARGTAKKVAGGGESRSHFGG